MNRLILAVFLATCCLTLQADNAPTKDPQTQEEQETCLQQRIKACVNKCDDNSKLADCAKLCDENVKNECREAGI